jgi:hypothetical protein
MKILKPFLLIFAALLAFGTMATPHARAQVTVSFFYNTLGPYGEWVQDPDYGYVWHPTNVDENWAPYTDGYWAYTDGGWTWVSYEDYGGVVYHYGRWAQIPGFGWVWVPGETWAPAWVSWRVSDDYVGWAPLPPEARWRAGFGFGPWVGARYDIGPGFYSFVGVGDFGAPALGAVILSRDRNVAIFNNTTNITNITTNNSGVYTGGPSYAKFAALSHRPIPTLKLVRQSGAGASGKLLSRQQGSQLFVVAPKVTAPANGKLPAPPKLGRTLTGAKADHGWDVVKDPAERAQMETKFKASAGAAYAPAKAVNPEDVKLVNEKTKGEGASKTLATDQTTKTEKSKTTDLTTLENAPATEAAGASPTPKAKKSHLTEGVSGTGESAGETPAPKIKKSKKAKTPSPYDSDTEPPKSSDSGQPKGGDSNLQPFLSGDSEKTKSSNSDKSRSSDSDLQPFKSSDSGIQTHAVDQSQAPPVSDKGEKSEKKKKGKGEATPGD